MQSFEHALPIVIAGLQAKLETYRELRHTVESEYATAFSPISQLFYPNENKLSEIIAFFLNPAEAHGQGDAFLQAFLAAFLPAGALTSFATADIRIEHPTAQKRRLDIYINLDHGRFGIGIENKIWAGDQPGQLSHYAQYLQSLYGDNYCLIYLPPYLRDPSTLSIDASELNSLKKSGRIICRDYSSDLLAVVDRWITVCKAEKVRQFLSYLKNHLEERFNGVRDMAENSLVVNHAMKSGDNLRVVLSILQAGNDLYTEIWRRFKFELLKLAEQEGLKLVDFTLEPQGKRWTWFTFAFRKGTKQFWVRFQFDAPYHRDFYYGVLSDPKSSFHPELSGHLNQLLGEFQKPTKYWVWWNWHRHRNWNKETFASVADGEMIEDLRVTLRDMLPKLELVIDQHPDLIWDTADESPVETDQE